MSVRQFDIPIPRQAQMLRIEWISLAGEPPTIPGKRSLTAKLAQRGWRILPIPRFRPSSSAADRHALIDFLSPKGWIGIPPDESDLAAREFRSRRAALAWAHEHATEAQAERGGQ